MFLMFAKFYSTIIMTFKFIVDIQSILRLRFTVHNIDIENINISFDFTYSASLRCFKAPSKIATDLDNWYTISTTIDLKFRCCVMSCSSMTY